MQRQQVHIKPIYGEKKLLQLLQEVTVSWLDPIIFFFFKIEEELIISVFNFLKEALILSRGEGYYDGQAAAGAA